jgi:hypothetical protein
MRNMMFSIAENLSSQAVGSNHLFQNMTLVMPDLGGLTCTARVGMTSRSMPIWTGASRSGARVRARSRETSIDWFPLFFGSFEKLVSSDGNCCCNASLEKTCGFVIFFVGHLKEFIGCNDSAGCAHCQCGTIGKGMVTRLILM